MSHYQKIAALLIRLVGTLLGLYGLLNLIFYLFLIVDLSLRNVEGFGIKFPTAAQEKAFLTMGLFISVVGAVIFLSSNLIGKFVGKGLDD